MKIPLFKIFWDKNDVRAVSESVKRGMNWAAGPNIQRFEEKLAKYLGIKHVVVFNSGTSALHSVLIAYGIGKGDEVVVPSFTFIATANAVLMVGAKPVFADIEYERYGLDPVDVERKITPRTKAIIPVHYGGCPAKIFKLKKIAKKHNILLIEDAAESFGAKENDKLVGTVGDASMFSLCQTKVFTSGEGGFIVTDSKNIAEKLKLLRSHGRVENSNYFISGKYTDYITLGYNFRMPDIVAALGISQLKKVDKLIKKRRILAFYFTKKLLGIKEIIIPKFPLDIFHVFQEYYIRVRSGMGERDELKEYLKNNGIGTRISFPPAHKMKLYKELGYKNTLRNTEEISSCALTLPLYPSLSKKEIDYIAEKIKKFYDEKSRNK